MRRREAMFILACLAHHDGENPDHLVGLRQGKRIWNRSHRSRHLSTDFKPLPSNPLGGYGQYYRGSLYRLGLTHILETANGIDQLTSLGDQFAEAFARKLAKTQYCLDKCQDEDELSLEMLKELGSKMCLCQLPTHNDSELKLLTDLFFGLGRYNSVEEASLRRQSLLFGLDVTSNANKTRVAITPSHFDSSVLCEAAYFGQLSPGGTAYKYTPPTSLQTCVDNWRLFTLHRYFSYALEHLLSALLEEMKMKRSDGLSLDEFLDTLNWKDIASHFEKRVARRPKELQLAKWVACILGRQDPINKSISKTFDEQTRLDATCNELGLADELSELGDTNPISNRVALALRLLFTLYCRFYHYYAARVKIWNDVAAWADNNLWFQTTIQLLDKHLKRDATIAELLHELLDQQVVKQYDTVMDQKGKLESPWFQHNGDKLVWQCDYSPIWRGSKMDNCLSILTDLNLVKVNREDSIMLTASGKALHIRLLDDLRSRR